MVQAKTRAAVLKAFEDGVIDTPQGAFIGSFSIAVVRVLLSSLASDIVPVSRREEVDARFLLAESDAVLPEPWSHQILPFRSRAICRVSWNGGSPGFRPCLRSRPPGQLRHRFVQGKAALSTAVWLATVLVTRHRRVSGTVSCTGRRTAVGVPCSI